MWFCVDLFIVSTLCVPFSYNISPELLFTRNIFLTNHVYTISKSLSNGVELRMENLFEMYLECTATQEICWLIPGKFTQITPKWTFASDENYGCTHFPLQNRNHRKLNNYWLCECVCLHLMHIFTTLVLHLIRWFTLKRVDCEMVLY